MNDVEKEKSWMETGIVWFLRVDPNCGHLSTSSRATGARCSCGSAGNDGRSPDRKLL